MSATASASASASTAAAGLQTDDEPTAAKKAETDGVFTNLIAVVALDIGTARSGYAYAASSDQIKVEEEFDGLLVGSGKIPTVVCTDRTGRFVSFGNRAAEMYHNPQGLSDNLAFFTWFKMLLYEHAAAKEWQRDSTKDKSPEVPAAVATKDKEPDKIMATSLDGRTQVSVVRLMEYTMQELARYAKGRLTRLGNHPSQSNVRWVITVPAIWSPAARQVMHTAALNAGFVASENQLRLCLEPDAAILAVQPEFKFPAGTRILIADLDFTATTVQEVKTSSKDLLAFGDGRKMQHHHLAELLSSSGGAWGSTYIDKHFIRMLDTTFGEPVMNLYRGNYPWDWYRILQTFEALKHKEFGIMKTEGPMPRSFSYHMKNMITHNPTGKNGGAAMGRCDAYSTKRAAEVAAAAAASSASTSYWPSLWSSSTPSTTTPTVEEPAVVWHEGTHTQEAFLAISRKEFNSYAQPIVQRTVEHANKMYMELLKQDKAPQYVVLAGGLAECKPMVDGFREWIEKLDAAKRPRLHCPGRAAISVLSGAVRDGLGTCVISSRIMPSHYAYVTLRTVRQLPYGEVPAWFAEATANIQRFKFDGEVAYGFLNAINWLTLKGKSYPVEHIEDVHVQPAYDGQKEATFMLYRAEKRDGLRMTTSDRKSVRRIGTLQVPCPDYKEVATRDRAVDVYIKFSDTRFEAAARERPQGGENASDVVRPWGDGRNLARGFTRGVFQYEPDGLDTTPDFNSGSGHYEEPKVLAPARYKVTLQTTATVGTECKIQLQLLRSGKQHDFTAVSSSKTPSKSSSSSSDEIVHLTADLEDVVLPTYCLILVPQLQRHAIFFVTAPSVDATQVCAFGPLNNSALNLDFTRV